MLQYKCHNAIIAVYRARPLQFHCFLTYALRAHAVVLEHVILYTFAKFFFAHIDCHIFQQLHLHSLFDWCVCLSVAWVIKDKSAWSAVANWPLWRGVANFEWTSQKRLAPGYTVAYHHIITTTTIRAHCGANNRPLGTNYKKEKKRINWERKKTTKGGSSLFPKLLLF